jgi:hypothetical protein
MSWGYDTIEIDTHKRFFAFSLKVVAIFGRLLTPISGLVQ